MKFRITQSTNSMSGKPIFYLHKQAGNEWKLVGGESTLEAARAVAQRLLQPKPDVFIEEIES